MTDRAHISPRTLLLSGGIVVAIVLVGAVATDLSSPSLPSHPLDQPSVSPPVEPAVTPSATASVAPTPVPSRAPAATPATTHSQGTVAVRIRIERLGIDLPIVEGDGVNAPDGEVAHFPGTAWPGAGSNTYLYGHAQEGLFLPLWEARIGDEIVLTLVDETTRCYRVERIEPETPWNDTSVLLPTEREQLTLQTSTSYTPTAPRFVVIARPCDA